MSIDAALASLDGLYARALGALRARVVVDGKPSAEKLDAEQLAAHGLAYLAVERAACRELAAWAARDGASPHEKRIAEAYVGEVTRGARTQLVLGACETVGVAELGLTETD